MMEEIDKTKQGIEEQAIIDTLKDINEVEIMDHISSGTLKQFLCAWHEQIKRELYERFEKQCIWEYEVETDYSYKVTCCNEQYFQGYKSDWIYCPHCGRKINFKKVN